ncbi:purine-nucleoside phosphorylase [Synechococcus sp. PCC 6312]|uniref:purine-nucleoside phosphorylase n=1 Tax=Synechococcus sp. (strain ATCC 27167 / PCC 6312) TaxID=195253 RepID=UPI00029F2CD6|nr:purine-nucleoside phosphorylase [Synechococcus sp. PCC 6312]AFY60784.1 purine nucleoside phosphorylase I, inosine and guanosine-specific [Synechococcus sp. PCC 6312]
MASLKSQAQATADFIQAQGSFAPDLVVVLGSGWGGLVECVTIERMFPYRSIPHFPQATVPGHGNQLILAKHENKSLMILSGRFHFYEGYSLAETIFPLRVAHLLGAKGLITTNAAGGVQTHFRPGDLMIITDHLNLLVDNPLRGMSGGEFGSRFVDLVRAYDGQWQDLAQVTAQALGLTCHRGVYAALPGPNYETPAEIRMLRGLGADAVGMSTVPEVIVARQMGMRVLALSCITNLGAGIANHPLNHEEVLTVGQTMQQSFSLFLGTVLAKMAT